MPGMFVLLCLGRIRFRAGLVSGMSTMPAMSTVHKQMAANHQSKEAIIRNGIDCHIENEYCRERTNQANA
jgi:hypothetical protein